MCKVKGFLKRTAVIISALCLMLNASISLAHEQEEELNESICVEKNVGEICLEDADNHVHFQVETAELEGEILQEEKKSVIDEKRTYVEFCNERTEFIYHYYREQEKIWSLEGDGTLQYWENGDMSTMTVFRTDVSAYYQADNCIYYSDWWGNVRKTDYNGQNDEFIFAASETIKEIVGNDEYLFYLTYKGVYRYHIVSKTNEFVYETTKGYALSVYDNQSFSFVEDTDTIAYSEEDGYYPVSEVLYYDMVSKESGGFEDFSLQTEKHYQENRKSVTVQGEAHENLYVEESICEQDSVEYGGTTYLSEENQIAAGLHFDDYGIGECFTYSGQACAAGAHAQGDTSNCYYFDGGIQCSGYAAYAYRLYHGTLKSESVKSTFWKNKNSNEYAPTKLSVSEWNSIPNGTNIRVAFPSNPSNIRHSIFVFKVENNAFTVYEANTDGRCGITASIRDGSYMASNYYVAWMFNPAFNDGDEVFQTYYSSNQDVHWVNCSGCMSRNLIEAHEGAWYNNGQGHSKVCSTCGYTYINANHTWEINSDGTTHWQECSVCGATNSSSQHNSNRIVNTSTGHTYYCDVCGRQVSTGGHSYGSYTKDGTYHWRVCTINGCTSVSDRAAHSYSYSSVDANNHRGTCMCGATTTAGHSMRTGEASATAHQLKCSVCSYTSSESHSFSISQNNASTHKKTCSKCGYYTTVSHAISYTNASATSHAYRCTICGYTGTANHTASSTIVTKVATANVCTRTAVKCACGYTLSTSTDYSHRYSGTKCLDCGYIKK